MHFKSSSFEQSSLHKQCQTQEASLEQWAQQQISMLLIGLFICTSEEEQAETTKKTKDECQSVLYQAIDIHERSRRYTCATTNTLTTWAYTPAIIRARPLRPWGQGGGKPGHLTQKTKNHSCNLIPGFIRLLISLRISFFTLSTLKKAWSPPPPTKRHYQPSPP